ncbi:hypothetical protein J560_1568 [Acinetobacter baumannii 855125]|nr:hypothetical protein J556_1125 [Acinetobacter baumannii 1096934]KCX75071.1 hypothetical protein J560_1568 [Acinetobacter baumannii 855125]
MLFQYSRDLLQGVIAEVYRFFPLFKNLSHCIYYIKNI